MVGLEWLQLESVEAVRFPGLNSGDLAPPWAPHLPLSEASGDACSCSLAPASQQGIAWLFGFLNCVQWRGGPCCELTVWLWEGRRGPWQKAQFPFKESSSFLVGIDLFQELSKSPIALLSFLDS